ncbi:YhgE/Pip domain-containing protein [Limosilactobacillus oris]|jgi:uncharacterized phage infection (PIP) family protein YhgE|uniref:YhgE/Pip domain-containing protein n=1 Tax=Limosilactobacillus oris TaxID=1632 RepID=UPI0022369FDE|nr:ABC transporter permease [Limosilactobacillus oris]MCW4388700.1 hypothetical protein [Limosilactobacillus oris]
MGILSRFLKSKGVILASMVMIVYGVLVFFIYFSGYKPLPTHIKDLPITIVSTDRENQPLKKQIKTSLKSFKHVNETNNINAAKKDLQDRQTFMVVEIPHNFTKKVTENKQANLSFYINDANQSLVVSGLKNIANNIGSAVNNGITLQKSKAIMTRAITEQLSQNNQAELAQAQITSLPAAQQKLATQQLEQQVVVGDKVNAAFSGVDNSVKTNIKEVNKVTTGINNSMAPFFISLSSYLAALIGALLLYGTYAKFSALYGRFKSFATMQTVMLLLSILGGVVVTLTVIPLTNANWGNFIPVWIAHSLEIWGAYNLNAIFILLLGQMGASINILFTMLQVVAGAGMVPVQIMTPFFKGIHSLSPMYYSIMSDYDLLYGSNSYSLWLGALSLVIGYLVINTVIVYFKKKQPMLDFRKLA